MTSKEFYQLCNLHDWTYGKSDDHTVYKRGELQATALRNAVAAQPEFQALYDSWGDWAWQEGPMPELDKSIE